jgi:tetratricopeptide (TPR) repeat protein
MKLRIIWGLILGFLLTVNSLAEGSADFYFQKGNEAYLAEKYADAIQQYESVLANGLESSALYYNLGNAYYKIGRLGKAILNYERALQRSPKDKNIQFNLRLANLRVKDRIDVPPEFFLFRWHRTLVQAFSISGWAWLMTLIFLVTCGLVVIQLVLNPVQLRRYLRQAAITGLVISALALGLLLARQHLENSHSYAIILSPSTQSLAAPQSGSTELFIVHEGTKVRVLDRDADWLKVELIDGKQGWITTRDLELI